MAKLFIQTSAEGNPGSINLFISVSTSHGLPVEGLTGENFSIKLAYTASSENVIDIPTMYSGLKYSGMIITDEGEILPEGESEPYVVSRIKEQGLPGFYALQIGAPIGWRGFTENGSYALQIKVQNDGDNGQAITVVTILTPKGI